MIRRGLSRTDTRTRDLDGRRRLVQGGKNKGKGRRGREQLQDQIHLKFTKFTKVHKFIVIVHQQKGGRI